MCLTMAVVEPNEVLGRSTIVGPIGLEEETFRVEGYAWSVGENVMG